MQAQQPKKDTNLLNKNIAYFHWLLIAFWALSTAVVSPANAEVIFDRLAKSEKMTLKLVGEIDGDMLRYFRSYLDNVAEKKIPLHMNAIQLNSTGGDMHSAIKIGRLIRNAQLNTYVDPIATCDSACVLVLMGGVERMPFGKTSVHRPILADIDRNMTQVEIEKMIEEDAELLRIYTREMGLSDLLADAINTTPSWAFRSPEPMEMRRWGLEGMTQSKEVALSLFAGRELKMSGTAFNKFMADNWTTCRTAALRLEKSPKECLNSLLLDKLQRFDK